MCKELRHQETKKKKIKIFSCLIANARLSHKQNVLDTLIYTEQLYMINPTSNGMIHITGILKSLAMNC